MESVIDEERNELKTEEKVVENKGAKKRFTIFGFTISDYIFYFIIYSIIGFIIETIFAFITTGRIESRQSFLYGPFCAVYGVGAVAMILSLYKFRGNNFKLFIGGFVVGSIVEYLINWIGETFFHLKYWDYSGLPLNINGRICIYFSLIWGVLAIFFIGYFHSKTEKVLLKIKEKIKEKNFNIIIFILSIFIIFDTVISTIAVDLFNTRKVYEYNINVKNIEEVREKYEKIYGNEELARFINTFWGDEFMIKVFPNLKLKDKDNNIVYFDTLVGDIKPYFFKLDINHTFIGE